jgi:hypothetical protein
MRRRFAPRAVPVALLGVIGCTTPDTGLDDALRQYIEQRKAEVEAGCECYHLFLNVYSPDNSMFASKEECLDTLLPGSEDDAVDCMRNVLADSGIGADESLDVVTCYTETIGHQTECYLDNVGVCDELACWSDVAKTDWCQGRLTSLQARTLYSCV